MRSRHIEEVAPELGRAGYRWVGGCDHVTRDEKGVDSLGPDRVEQPAEEEAMLILALDPLENVAKVPVTGLEDAQAHRGTSYGGDRQGSRTERWSGHGFLENTSKSHL
jgi:hypothetical protein